MKYLDLTGLQKLWAKIKENFASKSTATTSANGLMSATDKQKLDNTLGADQIKGIYLTGENRTIVGAESDVGIIWEGDGTLFKDENAVTEITNTHFMTRVPIVAGTNVTFETDTENQVVKINATGGGGGTNGDTPSKIEKGDSYVEAFNGGVDIEGEVLDVIGGTISIRDADSVNRIYLDEADGVDIKGSQINIETPTGNDEMARLSSDTVEIYGKSNVDLYASNGSVSINSPKGNTSIDGKTLSLGINNTYGTAGQVLMSDGTYAYWGDASGGTGESSIIDLGVQDNHKAAQQAMVDYVSSSSADKDCYLFKYWCSCYGNACFAVVFKSKNDTNINISGTVYDSMRGFREFVYIGGEFSVDGCWKNLASFDEEFEGLPTEDKSVLGAINEIYQKIGSSSGGTPTKIENGGSYVEITSEGDISLEHTNSGAGLWFYEGRCDMTSGTISISSETDLYIDGNDIDLRGNLRLYTKGSYGKKGQVLMNNGTNVYWGDVEGSSGGGSSSGGATLSTPRIRLANWYYDIPDDWTHEMPIICYESDDLWEGKIVFSVNVQDGTVQEGDQLQVCALRTVFSKKKLRPILSKTITAREIENLAKQPYLQISTDDFSGNNLATNVSKAIKCFYRTDSKSFENKKHKYIRIRRPVYHKDLGKEVNAIFSNVVPVEIDFKFKKIYE